MHGMSLQERARHSASRNEAQNAEGAKEVHAEGAEEMHALHAIYPSRPLRFTLGDPLRSYPLRSSAF